MINRQDHDRIPLKVLVFNGKCSKVFRSTLEDCVEDCILEFPSEKNSIYVPKYGPAIQISPGSNRNTIFSLREQSATRYYSIRLNRQRNSISQNNSLPQISSRSNSLSNNASLPTAALAATAAVRMRQELVQKRVSLNESISEEQVNQQSNKEEAQTENITEPEIRSRHPSFVRKESTSSLLNQDASSLPLPSFLYYSLALNKTNLSYRDRQKNYRLSDLVMFGPEYFHHVFNLPHCRAQSHERNQKPARKKTELDRIKQDLFHRYLWTQKPQVSCRIRPLSTYPRNSTFVT